MTKSIISFCICLFALTSSFANDSTALVYDTTQIEARHFEPAQIEANKNDSDFEYGLRPEAELTLWQRFKIWLGNLLQKLFTFGTETQIGKILIYLICGAVIIYALYKLSMINSSQVFYGERKKGVGFDLHHEDIHQLNFEKLIEEAIEKKDFRLAIRLTYLHALKHLADHQLIDWKPGKTNYDYTLELTSAKLQPGFNALSYYFDYAWYGDFEVSHATFEKVNDTFKKWRNTFKA